MKPNTVWTPHTSHWHQKQQFWPISHTSPAETTKNPQIRRVKLLVLKAKGQETGPSSRTWGASCSFILTHSPVTAGGGGLSMTAWGFGCITDWSEWGGGRQMLNTHHLLPTVWGQTKTFRNLWKHKLSDFTQAEKTPYTTKDNKWPLGSCQAFTMHTITWVHSAWNSESRGPWWKWGILTVTRFLPILDSNPQKKIYP